MSKKKQLLQLCWHPFLPPPEETAPVEQQSEENDDDPSTTGTGTPLFQAASLTNFCYNLDDDLTIDFLVVLLVLGGPPDQGGWCSSIWSCWLTEYPWQCMSHVTL